MKKAESQVEMRNAYMIDLQVHNRANIISSEDAVFACQFGYSQDDERDEEFYYSTVVLGMKYSVGSDNSDEIAYEIECEFGIRLRTVINDENDFIAPKEFLLQVGVTNLIGTIRARLGAVCGSLELTPPFHLPLFNAVELIDNMKNKEPK